MYEYFKLCKSIASCDTTEYSSIAELVKKMAIDAGYSRREKVLKNGKVVIRTHYDKPFDDVLTSKWFLFYEKMFYSKLIGHPELKEYYLFILQRTFMIYMNSLKLDMITCDAAVTKNVSMSLANRIGEALGLIGSDVRLSEYINKSNSCGGRNRLVLKYAINHMAISLDSLQDDRSKSAMIDSADINTNTDFNDILVDLRYRLKDNSVGLKLLDAMLYSNKKINFSKIGDYINLDKNQYSDDVKHSIGSAALVISNVLEEYVGPSKFNFTKFNKSLNKLCRC